MEKIDLIYDHYKTTMDIIANIEKKRGQLFIYIGIIELINFMFLVYPSELIESLNEYFTVTYRFEVDISILIIQSAIWIIIVYTLLRYYQINIQIERQYKYLHVLEANIGDSLSITYFNRESVNYLENFKMITDVFYIFYTWLIPLLFIAINGIKIYFEIKSQIPFYWLAFDFICCIFAIGLSILYLFMLHKKRK